MSNKFSIAENVAADMKSLLDSDEYKQVFAKPAVVAKKDDKDDKEKEEKEKAEKKEKEEEKKEKEDKKEASELSMPEVLKQAMNGIVAIAELLEAANLEKSAALTTVALNSVVSEAEELAKAGKLHTTVKIAKDECEKCKEKDCKCKEDDEDDKDDKKDNDDANDVALADDKKEDNKEDDKDEEKEEDSKDEGKKDEDEDDADEGDPLAFELPTREEARRSVETAPSLSEIHKELQRGGPGKGRGGAAEQETYQMLPSFDSATQQKAHEFVPPSGDHATGKRQVIPQRAPEAKPQLQRQRTQQRTEQGRGFGRGTPEERMQIEQRMPGAAPADDGAAAADGATKAAPHVNSFPTDDTYADSSRNDPNKDLPERAASVLNSWFVKMAQDVSLEELNGKTDELASPDDIEQLLSEIEGEGKGDEGAEFEESDIELDTVASFHDYLEKIAKKKTDKEKAKEKKEKEKAKALKDKAKAKDKAMKEKAKEKEKKEKEKAKAKAMKEKEKAKAAKEKEKAKAKAKR